MANKIQILSPEQARRIAAGEVVERPASVVKELVENALDAQATHITIFIEQVGKKLIRVVDNGCGMSPEDAHSAVMQHATSKIQRLDDLDALTTYGFRGEALAVINAVSHMRMTTRTAADALATLLVYEGGELVDAQTIAAPIGTDIAIADLFFNTPVRHKFLKSDETEWSAIQSLIYAVALANRQVYFKLFRDGVMVMQMPPVHEIRDRIASLWDHQLAERMIEVPQEQIAWQHKDLGAITITGALSGSQFWRHGRHQIYFFVNNRWIKNQELGRALMRGYGTHLPPGKFPAACLFVRLDAAHLDVNIHPRKEEIRFTRPGVVENRLQQVVVATLEQGVNRSLKRTFSPIIQLQSQALKPMGAPFEADYRAAPKRGFDMRPLTTLLMGADLGSTSSVKTALPELQDIIPNSIVTNTPEQSDFEEAWLMDESHLIGQFAATYLLLDGDDALVVIDQHAAHERILYERFTSNFETCVGTRLLFPLTIEMPSSQIAFLIQQQTILEQQGIEIAHFGADQLVVHATPSGVGSADIAELLRTLGDHREVFEKFSEEEMRVQVHEHVHSHLACKTAVKAGDVLTRDEMTRLIKDLFSAPRRHMCIHGRPTIWRLAKSELEKHFRR